MLVFLFRLSMVVMWSKYSKCVITIWVHHESIFSLTQPFFEIFSTKQLNFTWPRMSCALCSINLHWTQCTTTIIQGNCTAQFQSSSTFLDSQNFTVVPSNPTWTAHFTLLVLKLFPCLLESCSAQRAQPPLASKIEYRCPQVSSLSQSSFSSRTAQIFPLCLSADQSSLPLEIAQICLLGSHLASTTVFLNNTILTPSGHYLISP